MILVNINSRTFLQQEIYSLFALWIKRYYLHEFTFRLYYTGVPSTTLETSLVQLLV